jgi:hypothetical protein
MYPGKPGTGWRRGSDMARRTSTMAEGVEPPSASVSPATSGKLVITLQLVKTTKSYWVYGLDCGPEKGFIGKVYIPAPDGQQAPDEVQATFDLG